MNGFQVVWNGYSFRDRREFALELPEWLKSEA